MILNYLLEKKKLRKKVELIVKMAENNLFHFLNKIFEINFFKYILKIYYFK